MQQGICTFEKGKTIFMNDLCNRFTSELSGLKDFERNLNENEELVDNINPLDRKIFYSFQHEQGDDKIKGFKTAKQMASDGGQSGT